MRTSALTVQLAYVCALGFAQQRRGNPVVRAIATYPVFLLVMAFAKATGSVFHLRRQAVVSLRHPGETNVLGILAVAASTFFIFTAPFFLLLILTGDWLAGMVTSFAILVFVAVGVVLSLPRVEAGSTEKDLKRELDQQATGRPVYTFGDLARHPSAPPGTAADLLAGTLTSEVPQGALIGCIAASEKLFAYYEQFGMVRVPGTRLMINPDWDPAMVSSLKKS